MRPSVEWNKGKAVEWLLEQIKNDYEAQALEHREVRPTILAWRAKLGL